MRFLAPAPALLLPPALAGLRAVWFFAAAALCLFGTQVPWPADNTLCRDCFMRLRPTRGRGSAAMTAAWRRARDGLGHMQAAARLNLDAGDPVPAPQLVQRDAETVGDGDQGIAPAHGIELHVRRGRGGRGTGTTSASIALEAVAGAQMIGRGQLRLRHAVLPRHRGQRVSGRNAVVAPGVALGLGNDLQCAG